MQDNRSITLNEIALKLNKSRSTIARIIKKLKTDGILIRVGSDKNGCWKVKIT